jgi:hypothetical protein
MLRLRRKSQSSVARAVNRELRGGQPIAHDEFNGVRGLDENRRQDFSLGTAEVLKHEVCRSLTAGRATNSNANSGEITGAKGFQDVAHSVVTAVPATKFEFDALKRDVQFVVNNNQLRWVKFEKPEKSRDRRSRNVHESVRLHHDEPWAGGRGAALGDRRVRAMILELSCPSIREFGQNHLPNVVPIAGVAGSGISQSDHEPHQFVQVLLCFLFGLGGFFAVFALFGLGDLRQLAQILLGRHNHRDDQRVAVGNEYRSSG